MLELPVGLRIELRVGLRIEFLWLRFAGRPTYCVLSVGCVRVGPRFGECMQPYPRFEATC